MTERRTEQELRGELVRYSKWLYRLGYMPGTSGNLSVRLSDDLLLVTPTGASKCMLRADDMVAVDLDGHRVAGARNVTSEIGMHLAIYHQRHDIEAVVHSHPPIATGFACAGRGLDRMLCQEAVMALGPVPLARYATTGTPEVAASLEPLVADHTAILLANHGAVTFGPTLLDAFRKMETLEHLAHIHLVAHQLGSPQALEPQQIEQLHDARFRYLVNSH